MSPSVAVVVWKDDVLADSTHPWEAHHARAAHCNSAGPFLLQLSQVQCGH